MPTTADLERTARDAFGWPKLRPGQLQAMTPLLTGRDVVVVMPPGRGKSAVYQVPAVTLGGLAVVVSPLLALQRDQVAGLRERPAVGDAEVLNSTLSAGQRANVLARAGGLSFLYLGPEQLSREDVVAALVAARPVLFAVDEAHCVSQWGHDFRPDYLQIGVAIDACGHPPVCASTATASPPVRAEIIDRLRLREPAVIVRGFDRPEIHLAVSPPQESDAAKRQMIAEQAAGLPKPLLVYAATRRETTELAEELAGLGLSAAAYHGAMPSRLRQDTEQRWLDGDIDVMVATSAFGMGVDKANVRAVVHADPPESLDAYLQEIGRAARDGDPAVALLVWRPQDLGVRRFFASGLPRRASIAACAATVAAAGRPVQHTELSAELGWTRQRTERILDLLLQAGGVRAVTTEEGHPAVVGGPLSPAAAADAAQAVATMRHTVEDSRVDMVRAFAETRGCRRQLLLASFGEVPESPCANCDRCEAGLAEAQDVDQSQSPFPVGGAIRHAEWGDGLVVRFEGDRIIALFDTVGYRTLGLDAVDAHHLLERLGPP